MTAATHYKPEVYSKSGEISQHERGVQAQYDTAEKRAFYAQVMGDGTSNIHFGKWDDDIDVTQEGAYGKASDAMTDYMFALATDLLARNSSTLSYVDLGSGTGGAAIRLLSAHPSLTATCLNLCEAQNATAQQDAVAAGVADRFTVRTGSYDQAQAMLLPENNKQPGLFDVCFSQDAFVHSFSKVRTYEQALAVTKPGGVFVFCDLMCGDGPDVSEDELATFAATNMVNDWLSPAQNVKACEQAGWQDVVFIDMTVDIKKSFQLMGQKVTRLIESGAAKDIDPVLLDTYRQNLAARVGQVDRGVFSWGVIHARKAE
jgi:sarcosine/dimethylglycine N-methyltransferase